MEILENIYEINRLLMGAYIYFGKEKTKVERASEFQKHMRIKLKDNEIIFKTISTFLRQTFK